MNDQMMENLPAHAGVILSWVFDKNCLTEPTRTRGGDPNVFCKFHGVVINLPAHAGVILI